MFLAFACGCWLMIGFCFAAVLIGLFDFLLDVIFMRCVADDFRICLLFVVLIVGL